MNEISLTRKQKPSKAYKKHTDLLELKNTKSILQNSIKILKSRLNHAEERISNLEDKTLEIPQRKKERKKGKRREDKRRTPTRIMGYNEKKQYSQYENSRRRRQRDRIYI